MLLNYCVNEPDKEYHPLVDLLLGTTKGGTRLSDWEYSIVPFKRARPSGYLHRHCRYTRTFHYEST